MAQKYKSSWPQSDKRKSLHETVKYFVGYLPRIMIDVIDTAYLEGLKEAERIIKKKKE